MSQLQERREKKEKQVLARKHTRESHEELKGAPCGTSKIIYHVTVIIKRTHAAKKATLAANPWREGVDPACLW